MEDNIKKLADIIKDSKNIVFFGGAGVSTESGIPDFRSSGGVYESKFKNLSPEYIVSRNFFYSEPKLFYEFYFSHLVFKDALPNKAHYALTSLQNMGKDVTVVTQNIDGLHQKAGTKKVYELHGSVLKNACLACGKKYDIDYMVSQTDIPRCTCGGMIKPDVVLYNENLDYNTIDKSVKAISEADLLIIAGTSLVVYPAALFIDYFRGKHLVIINLSPTQADSRAELVIKDKVGEVLDKVIKILKE